MSDIMGFAFIFTAGGIAGGLLGWFASCLCATAAKADRDMEKLFSREWPEPQQMIDIVGARRVEINVRQDGKLAWVNVDNECRLRCCAVSQIAIQDARYDAI